MTLEQAQAAARAATRLRLRGLAWKHRPDLGARQTSHDSTAAVCAVDVSALTAYMQTHEAALRAELVETRAAAKAQLERAKTFSPTSVNQWEEWFTKHADEFGERMKTATARRRELSRRMKGDANLPDGKRIQPRQAPLDSALPPGLPHLLRGRVGWHCYKHAGDALLFFLYVHRSVTYAADLRPLQVRGGLYRWHSAFSLAKALKTLAAWCQSLHADGKVWEALVTATSARGGGLDFEVTHAAPIVEPLRRPPRRAAARAKAKGKEEDCEDATSESDSARDGAAAKDFSDSDTPSVDTDMDDGVEVGPPPAEAARAPPPESADSDGSGDAPGGGGSGDAPDSDVEGGVPLMRRLPPGTWSVWESLWFYMTQTPGWTDVKVYIKGALCQYTTGMGRDAMSRTLTPWHYLELQTDPRRTKLLLQAWCVWRCQKEGWAAAKPARKCELAKLTDALEAGIRLNGDPLSFPLLGGKPAHKWLVTWVPSLVRKILDPQ